MPSVSRAKSCLTGMVGLGGGPAGPRACVATRTARPACRTFRCLRLARRSSAGRRGRRGGGTSPARPGTRSIAQLNQPIAVEAAAVRTAFARGDFVGANVLVRELDADFKFDGDEVVPLKLPRVTARDDGLDGRDALLAAERVARAGEHGRRLAARRRRLRGLCEGDDTLQEKSERG